MNEIKKFYNLFNKKQKFYFVTFCIFFFLASIFQLLGVSSIVFAVAVFSDSQTSNIIENFINIDFSSSKNQYTLFISIIFLLIFSTVLNFICLYLFVKISAIATIILETKFFNYYNNLGYFDKSPKSISKFITIFREHIPRIRSEFLPSIFTFIYNLSLAIIILFSVFIVAKEIFFQIGIIITIVYGLFYLLTKNKIKNYADNTIQILDKYTNFSVNFFNNFKSYKFMNSLLIEKNNNYYVKKINNLIVKQFLLQSAPRALIELILYFGIFLLMINIFIFNTQMPAVTLTFFAISAAKAFPTINQLFASFVRIEQSIPLIKNFNKEFININKYKDFNFKKNIKSLNFEKNIKLENVKFQFLNNKNHQGQFQISNLNLIIKKNSITGIAGKTGSGKSTLIDILSGIFKPDEGCLSLDDVKINEKNLHQYRKNIGYISQNIFLGSGTIKDIIQFGSNIHNNEKEKLEYAAKKAEIFDFVNNLPEKFNTFIGDGGIDLSSGQKQRILLSRFFYLNSEILILDEATNLLDLKTEDTLINNLINDRKNKTIIVVTHGIQNLKKFDNILFIKDGSLIAQGSYQILKKKSSIFREFVEKYKE
jgi:ATP-binding cassette subfamily B protein